MFLWFCSTNFYTENCERTEDPLIMSITVNITIDYMFIRLGGFWGLFFNSILPQNSDGDFVSGNHKKNFLVIRKFFAYQKWQFENSNLHNMSFFQSCSILTFYSLKWPSRWVGSGNIYVGGYLIHSMGDNAPDRVQKGHFKL